MVRPATAALVLLCAVAVATGCGSGKGGTTNNTTVVVGAPTNGPTRVYRVPSGSMEPTYGVGARVLVQQGAPQVGAVVIFHPPEGAVESRCGEPHPMTAACDAAAAQEDTGISFIKRIVAGPGDSIYIKEGHVYRKPAGQTTFTRQAETYINPCAAGVGVVCNLTTPITIPPGQWFLLGDNRGESDDSRFWGPVPAAWIVGVVTGVE